MSASRRKFFTVWPSNASQRSFCLLRVLNYSARRSVQIAFLTTCVYLRVNLRLRFATQRKSVRKFIVQNLGLLASPFGQGVNRGYSSSSRTETTETHLEKFHTNCRVRLRRSTCIGKFKTEEKILNFILQNFQKQTVPHESTAP